MMTVEGCRKTTVQAPLYPPLLSTFFPSLLQLSTLAIPRDVGLGFFGSSLGSWRFCLMGFVWGLCWASIRLRFGGFPYRWSRLIAGSEHNKQGAENTQKELQGKGRFSFFGTSGKDHGSFSLLPPRCPGLIEDRRADKKKKHVVFLAAFSVLSLFHTQSHRTCVLFSFLFHFISRSLALCPPRLVHSERGHLVKQR